MNIDESFVYSEVYSLLLERTSYIFLNWGNIEFCQALYIEIFDTNHSVMPIYNQ